MSRIREQLGKYWEGEVQWNCALAKLTTLKVGGPAEAVVKPKSLRQLQRVTQGLNAEGMPWLVIGRGSNILASDAGIEGVVIVLDDEFSVIRSVAEEELAAGHSPEGTVHVEAGCSLAKLGRWCRVHSLSGLEFAAGIPGSVGGAIVMNAGAWGHEIKDVLSAVELLNSDGKVFTEKPHEGDFSYRKWHKLGGRTVVGGVFKLIPSNSVAIGARIQHYVEQRNIKQPRGLASAGSFFKNPPGDSAGRLIEKAGLKGKTVGGAQISEKHANFLVNTGAACAQDFYDLMGIVQRIVAERFNITLEAEVQLVGQWRL